MSMPSFPEIDPDLTHEKALDMILASIALEELGLSHIINAEGEKLQYILDTLPCKHGGCASTHEILMVNDSITRLLDSVLENQIVLKNKLTKVLQAFPEQYPPCPYPPHPPSTCCRGSSIVLYCGMEGYCLQNGTRLPWRCSHRCGGNIMFHENDPCVIRVNPACFYMVYLSMEVRRNDSCGQTVCLSMQTVKEGRAREVFPYHFDLSSQGGGRTAYLSDNRVLPLETCSCDDFPLMLVLKQDQNLCIKNACLSIVEL